MSDDKDDTIGNMRKIDVMYEMTKEQKVIRALDDTIKIKALNGST